MKFGRGISNWAAPGWKAAFVVLSVIGARAAMAESNAKTAQTMIWDTVPPFGDVVDLRQRANWKLVPTDLLTLEADPAAASSDPGYYGREYAFQGDTVVENGHITAVFWSKKGRVVIYSRANSDQKKLELTPLALKSGAAKITDCVIVRNTGEEVVLDVSFSAGEGRERLGAIVAFDRTEIVELRPAEGMTGISLLAPIQYGIAPGFIGDDLIYNSSEYPSTNTLCVPSENLFLGLLEGQTDVLVVTWPEGKQKMSLALGAQQQKPRLIESVDIDNDGKSVYLALLSAPGIWHREELTASYLEKDVASGWKRPFAAKWVTQLDEAGTMTTFTFKESKQEKIWRGVIGSYVYPVWFDQDGAFYHLSKKVLPKGESVVYFLERSQTPDSVSAPADILKATLGRQTSDRILDVAGRKLRTHHRRGAAGVRRACTCGCTEAIQTVFEAHEEAVKQEYVHGAVDDMVFFVRRHVERINEYQAFAGKMIEYVNQTRKSAADAKPFLDRMEAIAREIPQAYSRQRENIKTLEYADELARKTKVLSRKRDPANLPAYLDLSKDWRAMGGAQDDLVAHCHTITRKLFQEAGYGCANLPRAVEMAQEIRRRCRECLRNPDGYEIWADY